MEFQFSKVKELECLSLGGEYKTLNKILTSLFFIGKS